MLIDYAENKSEKEQVQEHIQTLIDKNEWRGIILAIAQGAPVVKSIQTSMSTSYTSGIIDIISQKTLENATGIDGGIMLTSLKYIFKKLFTPQSDADWRKLVCMLGLKKGVADIVDQEIEKEFILYYINTWLPLKPDATEKEKNHYAHKIHNTTQKTFENYIKNKHRVKIFTTI